MVLGCTALLGACAETGNDGMPDTTLSAVLQRHTDVLMALPGVVAVGESVCDGVPCIKVYVVERTPEVVAEIPETLEDYPVVVEGSGEIRPLDQTRGQGQI
jgi:hypothetical protein